MADMSSVRHQKSRAASTAKLTGNATAPNTPRLSSFKGGESSVRSGNAARKTGNEDINPLPKMTQGPKPGPYLCPTTNGGLISSREISKLNLEDPGPARSQDETESVHPTPVSETSPEAIEIAPAVEPAGEVSSNLAAMGSPTDTALGPKLLELLNPDTPTKSESLRRRMTDIFLPPRARKKKLRRSLNAALSPLLRPPTEFAQAIRDRAAGPRAGETLRLGFPARARSKMVKPSKPEAKGITEGESEIEGENETAGENETEGDGKSEGEVSPEDSMEAMQPTTSSDSIYGDSIYGDSIYGDYISGDYISGDYISGGSISGDSIDSIDKTAGKPSLWLKLYLYQKTC